MTGYYIDNELSHSLLKEKKQKFKAAEPIPE
jgi:hypothetical protein